VILDGRKDLDSEKIELKEKDILKDDFL